MTRLTVVPTSWREAAAFVARHHRHHPPPRGCICCLAVADEAGAVHGVAIVGRPCARRLQDGFTAEVTRCCTDSTPHVASKLYAAAWRASRALGYRRLVTYTLVTERGTSLRAAGFRELGRAGGGSWSRADRPRVDLAPTQYKIRWELTA